MTGVRFSTELATVSLAALSFVPGVMNVTMMKKPPASSAKLYQLLTTPCRTCGGIGWVCEWHTLRAVGHDGCGHDGKPCRCNPEAVTGWDDDWAIGRRR